MVERQVNTKHKAKELTQPQESGLESTRQKGELLSNPVPCNRVRNRLSVKLIGRLIELGWDKTITMSLLLQAPGIGVLAPYCTLLYFPVPGMDDPCLFFESTLSGAPCIKWCHSRMSID